MRAFFVTGSGTDVGKTYVAALLARDLRMRGETVMVLKPLASGVAPIGDPAFAQSDTARLLQAQGVEATTQAIEACSPWRFQAPLAPNMAAAAEGRTVTLDELLRWCRSRLASAPPGATVIFEGAGGVMSPITNDATGLDWMVGLDLPVLLVGGTYLGAISHTLCSLAALRTTGLTVMGVVVNEALETSVSLEQTVAAIERFVDDAPTYPFRLGETRLPSRLSAMFEN